MKVFISVWSLDELREGDIVRGLSSGLSYVVCANYGDHVTAVRVQDISNPSEWNVLRDVVESPTDPSSFTSTGEPKTS